MGGQPPTAGCFAKDWLDMLHSTGGNDLSAAQWIKPQLTRLVKEAPTGHGWLHEIKYDGYRMLANRRPYTPALRVIASSCSW